MWDGCCRRARRRPRRAGLHAVPADHAVRPGAARPPIGRAGAECRVATESDAPYALERSQEILCRLVTDYAQSRNFLALGVKENDAWRAEQLEALEQSLVFGRVGGHIRLQFADAEQLDAAARAFPRSTSDPVSLSLQVPSDGGLHALRSLLDALDRSSLTPDELSVHLPDLDDVFLSLTGQARTERS